MHKSGIRGLWAGTGYRTQGTGLRQEFDMHFKVKRKVGDAWGLTEDRRKYLLKRQVP